MSGVLNARPLDLAAKVLATHAATHTSTRKLNDIYLA